MAAQAKRQKVGGADDEVVETTSLKGTFAKDLIPIMYAFGDDETPLPETLDLMEEIVIGYASGVLRKSMDLASLRGKARPPLKGVGAVAAEDVMAVVRRDPKKYERVRELFELQKELKDARASFDQDEEALKKLAEEVHAEEPGGAGAGAGAGGATSPEKR